MAPLSYADRQNALAIILDDFPLPTDLSALAVELIGTNRLHGDKQEVRDLKLDFLLNEGWSGRSGLQGQSDLGEADLTLRRDVEHLRLNQLDFTVLARVGDGQFGVVDAVRCKLNGTVYAMKTVEKSVAARAGYQLSLPIERHLHLLARTSFPSSSTQIPHLLATFQTQASLHLITTYLSCGTLWDRICSFGKHDVSSEVNVKQRSDVLTMSEDEALVWATQLVNAIEWVHSKGFVHRDIKPHNCLLHPHFRLLLTDFGSSAPVLRQTYPVNGIGKPLYVAQQYCDLLVGTPDYIAPEVLHFAEDAVIHAMKRRCTEKDGDMAIRAGYDASVDWWSFGVTLFEMVTGKTPFFAASIRRTYECILQANISPAFPCEIALSRNIKACIRELLFTPAEGRLGYLGSIQVKAHAFFNGSACSQVGISGMPLSVSPLVPLDIESPITSSVGAENPSYTTLNEITFDHFFKSAAETSAAPDTSVDGIILVPDAMVSGNTAKANTTKRWLGWTCSPPANCLSAVELYTTTIPQSSVTPRSSMFRRTRSREFETTPPSAITVEGITTGVSPILSRDTTSNCTPRSRPSSDRRALRDLERCVHLSARKRVLAMGMEAPGRLTWTNSTVTRTPQSFIIGSTRPEDHMLIIDDSECGGIGAQDTVIAELMVWHESIESAYANLQQRLISMGNGLYDG